MISDLYGDKILEAAANIPASHRLEKPDVSTTKVSRICGSELDLDLVFGEGIVVDVGLDARACALGQAAASITVQNIIGATADELFLLRDQIYEMLKNDGGLPTGERWQDLAALAAIKDYPQRHASTMLIFEAIVECLLEAGFNKPDTQSENQNGLD